MSDVGSDDEGSPAGYEEVKSLAKQLQRPIATMIALSNENDPFLADRPGARLEGARWFAELWKVMDPSTGIHLRRLHYRLLSSATTICPDNSIYENTDECWRFLGRAASDARYLGLVPPGRFVDRRAQKPLVSDPPAAQGGWLYTEGDLDSPPFPPEPPLERAWAATAFEPKEWWLPLRPRLNLSPPKPAPRYRLEIWCEKSTINDILRPLGSQHGITVIVGAGEMSTTTCSDAVDRIERHRLATRILYVSDFDPAGHAMPISVSRKIEYFLIHRGIDLDVRIVPVSLTAAQVAEYDLPRVPIKSSDRRKDNFENQHGEGAVELDALVALRPGSLEQILEGEIARYRDPTLDQRIDAKADEVDEKLREIEGEIYTRHADALAEAEADFQATQEAIVEERRGAHEREQEIERLGHEHNHAIRVHEYNARLLLAAWHDRWTPTWDTIRRDLREASPSVDEIDWPEHAEANESPDPLFDSYRSYVEQIDRYKRHQGKPTKRKGKRGS